MVKKKMGVNASFEDFNDDSYWSDEPKWFETAIIILVIPFIIVFIYAGYFIEWVSSRINMWGSQWLR